MLYHVVSREVALRVVVLCYLMLRYLMLCYVVLCDVMIWCVRLCYALTCRCTSTCYFVMFYAVLGYANAAPHRGQMRKIHMFSYVTCTPRYSSNNNAEGNVAKETAQQGRTMRFLFEMWRV